MRPTRAWVLLAAAVVASALGAAVTVGLDRYSSGVLPLTWLGPALLVGFAVFLGLAARAVRGWVQERRHDRQLDSLRVVRLLVLAKASAVLGALVLGGYLGVALALLARTGSDYAEQTAVTAAVTAVAGLLVTGAALALERACIAPDGGVGDPRPSTAG